MEYSLKKAKFLEIFKSINHNTIKYQGPLILRMYGLLNDLNLRRENRYILCNFIDQNSRLFKLKEDIYKANNEVSLNQLFLFAYHKAKANNLIGSLYNEYINCVNAISGKIDINIR
jgi:hypothetical protein